MDPLPPQPTVMVTGSVGRQLRAVAFDLLAERSTAEDGAVVVTTREPPVALARLARDGPAFDADHLAVVDLRDAGEETVDVGRTVTLDPQASPGTIDDAVGESLTWLDGVDRRHFLYDTLATNYRVPDPEDAYERAYQLAMTVGAEDGLALFTLDTSGLEQEVVDRLSHLFDVHVELRGEHGDAELRWTGLLGASEEWVPLAEADLGVGGFE